MSRLIQFAGFGVAVISLFLPAYSMPFVGNVSLLQGWQGWLILILIAAGVVTAVLNYSLWTKVAGGLALGATVVFLVLVLSDLNQMNSQIGSMAPKNLSFGLAWSWYPLIVGLILVQLAPLMSQSRSVKAA
ncbi:hypothetical protein [Mesorhizobium sp. A556]